MFATALRKARAAFVPPLWRKPRGRLGGGRLARMHSTSAQNSCQKHPSPTLPCAALRAREGAAFAAALQKTRAAFAPPLLAQPRGRLGGGRFARMRSTTAQNPRQKHPSPTLPCAARKGGGNGCRCAAKSASCFCPSPLAQPRGRPGGVASRACAPPPRRTSARSTPPQPSPALRAREGAAFAAALQKARAAFAPPLWRKPRGRLGGGRLACVRSTTARNSREKHPSPTLPCAQGRGVTSAQDRRQGRCAS